MRSHTWLFVVFLAIVNASFTPACEWFALENPQQLLCDVFSVEGNNLSPEKNEPVDELKLRTQLYLNCITLQSTVWFQIPLMCVQCLLRAAAAGSLSGSE